MPRKRYGLKIFLGIGIAALACYLVFAVRARRTLNHELQLARKEGLWTTLDDIANRPVPPAAKNAALIYAPLCASFRDALPTGTEIDNALQPGGEAAFEAFYGRAGPFLHQFEQAAAMPGCQFQRNWRLGPALVFPEFAEMKGSMKLICFHAALLSRHGHPIEGLDLIRRFAPMARHAGTDPILISELVEISMDAVVFRAVQTILGAHGLEAGVVERAKAALAALGPPLDPMPQLSGELALGLNLMNDPDVRKAYEFDGWQRVLSYIPAVRDLWSANLANAYRGAFTAVRDTRPDLLATLTRIRRQESMRADIGIGFVPSTGGWFIAVIKDAANRAGMESLLSGLEIWCKTGVCPSKSPNPPNDPRTNAPLKFARIKGGFKVWCVAPDGTDHGGAAYVPGSSTSFDHRDIIYAIRGRRR